MKKHLPSYINLNNGELDKRAERLREILSSCQMCPHNCLVNRIEGGKGFCKGSYEVLIDGYGPHYGEEDVLVGKYGSGTIFFSKCTMRCVFCQNYEISQCDSGDEISVEELAHIMISLQNSGCHNINLVSPTHYVYQIVEAIKHAVTEGLSIPIVYNTGGYESVEIIKLLKGIIDIYMPDIKFGDNEKAKKYTKTNNYFDVAKKAVKEMHKQVGELKTDTNGIAYRGLLIRHLVLPNNISSTDRVMKFISEEISKNAMVNVMAQYYPAHLAYNIEGISRRISKREYIQAVQYAEDMGLTRLITSVV